MQDFLCNAKQFFGKVWRKINYYCYVFVQKSPRFYLDFYCKFLVF